MFSFLLLSLACRSDPPPERPTVVLITMDTTRADALGCYGGPENSSTHIDALAAAGVRFEMALSHVPTTLSAHSSLFTGLDPHGHAVPRNGYPLDPSHSTLAERFKALGYDTIGIIAATALESKMGLTRGFRVYNEDLSVDLKAKRRFEDRADRVTARALAAVDARDSNQPLFLWVHYYDAHSPYTPPEDWKYRFVERGYEPTYSMGRGISEAHIRGDLADGDRQHMRNLYQAEVAFQDEQIGALMEGLEARRLMGDALVVLTADHGEMFFESKNRPVGHGPDVDLAVTRIPMVIHGRGSAALTPRVVDEPVALSEVGGTLLAMFGDEAGLGEARDLRPLLTGGAVAPRPIFLEATKPQNARAADGWNNIRNERGVALKDYVVYKAPIFRQPARLFTLTPAQERLKVTPGGPRAELLMELEGRLDQWDAAAPPHRDEDMDDETIEGLRALGYIDE